MDILYTLLGLILIVVPMTAVIVLAVNQGQLKRTIESLRIETNKLITLINMAHDKSTTYPVSQDRTARSNSRK